jgi:hypothetical protein
MSKKVKCKNCQFCKIIEKGPQTLTNGMVIKREIYDCTRILKTELNINEKRQCEFFKSKNQTLDKFIKKEYDLNE